MSAKIITNKELDILMEGWVVPSDKEAVTPIDVTAHELPPEQDDLKP